MRRFETHAQLFKRFLCIYSHYFYMWMFLCTNVDRNKEPHVCKYQYSHVHVYICMFAYVSVSLFVFVYSSVEVSCICVSLRFPCAWFMSFFVKLLPLPLVKRFWDLLVLEGGDVLVTLCAPGIKARESFGANQCTI